MKVLKKNTDFIDIRFKSDEYEALIQLLKLCKGDEK